VTRHGFKIVPRAKASSIPVYARALPECIIWLNGFEYENVCLINPRWLTVTSFFFFFQELNSVFSPYFQILSPYGDTASPAGQLQVVAMRAKMSSKRMFAVGASVLIHFATPVH